MVYQYDVAISFAGEDRAISRQIADSLQSKGIKVFYDEYEEENFLGEDLYEHLHDIYSNKARFCVMVISANYAKKAWTNHERKSAQERAFRESKGYILPVRLDDTLIPGISATIGYFDLQTKSVQQLVAVIEKKLNPAVSVSDPLIGDQKPMFAIPLPKIKRGFTERDKDKFNEESFVLIKNYFKEGIAKLNTMDSLEGEFTDITSNRFSCKIYMHGKRLAQCTIWFGSSFSQHNSICYSNQANQESTNSMNDILSIEEIGDVLTFKAILNVYSSKKADKLSSHEAAEYLWGRFIEPLNR